jgi:hypothetical protein
MLQLFQSIFGAGHDAAAPYPAELIERAIERAVDGTDPRLRAVSGYRKKLRAAVIRALNHVMALVDGLPPALELGSRSYGTDPEITAYFASNEHLREVLSFDRELNEWRKSHGTVEHVFALLLMIQQERQVFGTALEGGILRRDVAQTTVSFANHRLVDPTGALDDTRRRLKRRAYDHLLTRALERIMTADAERGSLERDRRLLQRKLAAFPAGRWGFDEFAGDERADPATVQKSLEEIESQLNVLGAGTGLLAAHLDIVVDVLTRAEHHFSSTRTTLIVDRLGVKQTQASEQAPEIGLTVLHNAAGQRLVARLVGIASTALPLPRDWLREAQRYIG